MGLSDDAEQPVSEVLKMTEIEATMKRRALILDSLNLIPVYTGQDVSWTLDQFKTKFKSLAEFLLWPEEDQLFAFQHRLAGLALQTYVNFKSKIKTVQDLFKILSDKFDSKRDQGDLLNEFWLFKQQQDTSVAEFIAKAIIKANVAISAHNLPKDYEEKTKEQWLLSMLQKNLLPSIRKGVIARNPKTFKELEEIALLEERAYKAVPFESEQTNNLQFACALSANKSKEGQRNEESDKFKLFTDDFKEQLNALSRKISDLESSSQKRNKDNIICHFCSARGHTQRFCRERLNRRVNYRSPSGERENENSRTDREEIRRVRFSRGGQDRSGGSSRNFFRSRNEERNSFRRNSNGSKKEDNLNN